MPCIFFKKKKGNNVHVDFDLNGYKIFMWHYIGRGYKHNISAIFKERLAKFFLLFHLNARRNVNMHTCHYQQFFFINRSNGK